MVSLDSPVLVISPANKTHKYETLRIYAPLNSIPRYTGESNQALQIHGKDYNIPPRTAVFADNGVAQRKQQYWGNDAHVWRLDRWIKKEGTSKAFVDPIEGSYVPWAYGPRICPGKKFSQVEFVATISYLLKDHRVRPMLVSGESESEALERMLGIIQDSEMEMAMAIKMTHPEKLRSEKDSMVA